MGAGRVSRGLGVPDRISRGLSVIERASVRAAATLDDCAKSARFLRERREFTPRDSDVFIASYPRSGTTWLQWMTHLVLRGGGFDFRHISDVVPWFERSLSLGRKTAADFDAMPAPRAFKTHLPHAWLPPRGRYVYVARDVADVAASYFELYRSHLGFTGSFAQFFERFVRGRVQYRSWFDHVSAWRALSGHPRVLFFEYEQLLAAPEHAVRMLARFLDVSPTDAEVRRIASLCDFEAMKKEEHRFDHATEELFHFGMRTGRFVRTGRRGGGASVLSPSQREALERQRDRSRRSAPRWTDLPAFLQ